jgi:serine/threonine-protein kinase
VQEAWKEFATLAEARDPGRTVTLRDHAVSTPAKADDLPFIHLGDRGDRETDFEVTGVLGEGGMGKVLLARQRSLGRDVAIKVVKEDIGEDRTLGALFEEARITGSLEHPSIVPVHALGKDVAGRPVLVMKRIEGEAFRELVRDGNHPRWASFSGDRVDAIVEIVMAACNALHFAHVRGIVHRDIKLENVMIGSFGEVYVVDWGIAINAPVPGARSPMVGTPTYMAPELAAGDLGKTSARTDVFLLGATLHHALTGTPRHLGDSLYSVLFAAIHSEPVAYDANVPAELADICNRATHRDPEQRYESALALRRALEGFKSHRGSTAISDEATARLADLERAIAERADERTLQSLMIECRFGFTTALRAWGDNQAAQRGLQRTLELSIEHEIERRDAERARSLLAELRVPVPGLEERIDALEESLREEAREHDRIRSVARDQDLRVGGGAQLAILSILPAFAAGLASYVLTRGRTLTHVEIVGAPLLGALLLASGALVLRRKLRTSISRRAIGALVLLPFAIALHRVLAFHMGDSLVSMMATDEIIGATFALVIGITIVRQVAWIALPLTIAGVAGLLLPRLALPIFVGAVICSFSVLVLAWRRAIR